MKPQSYISLYDQLLEVRLWAIQNGYNNAADFITENLKPSLNVKTNPGKFYIKFDDENIEEAISNHSTGFESIEDAIEENDSYEEPGSHFVVLDSSLKTVYSGTVKGKEQV